MLSSDEIGRRLDGAMKAAGVPILGLSIGDWRDRRTWTAIYAEAATKEQRIAGDALIASFDPEGPAVVDAVKVGAAEAMADSPMIRAFYLWWFRKTNKRDPTSQERAADIAELVQSYKDVS